MLNEILAAKVSRTGQQQSCINCSTSLTRHKMYINHVHNSQSQACIQMYAGKAAVIQLTCYACCVSSVAGALYNLLLDHCSLCCRMSVRDQVISSLSEKLPNWRLSCFSGADSKASDLGQQARSSNEVNGDVSFEEVRWADYETPDKSKCAPRFAQATTLKNQQFEVGQSMCSDQPQCKLVVRLTSHFDCRVLCTAA